MAAAMAALEDELRKLAKLPENKRCANCEKEDKVFGYKNICMPYRTFVCGMCKAAHQAFSHRVKEINQSNFTAAEVESLRPRSGGSNDAARRTWLASCPLSAPERPHDGDPLDKYKAFVVNAYERRRWYAADTGTPPAVSSGAGTPSEGVGSSAPPPPLQLQPAASFGGLTQVAGRWGSGGGGGGGGSSAAPSPAVGAPMSVAPAAVALPPVVVRAPVVEEEEPDLLGMGGGEGGVEGRGQSHQVVVVVAWTTSSPLVSAPRPSCSLSRRLRHLPLRLRLLHLRHPLLLPLLQVALTFYCRLRRLRHRRLRQRRCTWGRNTVAAH